MNANLARHLVEAARRHPGRAAIIETRGGRDRVWTFAAMDAASARAAATYRAAGLQPGEGVLLWQPMSAALYILLLGAWRAGLVGVFVDPGQPRRRVAACARRRPPRAVAGPWFAHLLAWTLPGLGGGIRHFVTRGWFPGARRAGADGPAPAEAGMQTCEAGTPALVTFTSGSTGDPKGIVRSHGFLELQHQALCRELRLEPGQVDLTGLPIFLLANLGVGVTSIIPAGPIARPGAIDPGPVLAQLRRHRPDRAAAAPAFWERLLGEGASAGEAMLSLKQIYTGGGPVYPDLLTRLQHAAPAARVVGVYGSTEAEPMAHVDAVEAADAGSPFAGRCLPAGMPVEGLDLRIMSDHSGQPLGAMTAAEFATMILPAGQIGEIVASGPLVIPGYLDGHGDAETKFRVDGAVWHRTGDAGVFDERGRLWLAGRCAGRVRWAGRTAYPLEAELPARAVAGVRGAALVEVGGRAVLAVAVQSPDALDAVRRRLDSLGLGAVEVRRLPVLPVDRRHNSKTDYAALRRMLS